MKHIKKYTLFLENIKNEKKYLNIKNDGEYYQVPFSLMKNKTCFRNDDNYALCFNSHFYYDDINDNEIEKILTHDLSNIDITKGWEGQTDGFFAFQNIDVHIIRIAKLVQEMEKNIPINPINVLFDEKSFIYRIPNYIEDGNHRIRAIKYLKYDYFPAYIYGSHSKYLIDYLNSI